MRARRILRPFLPLLRGPRRRWAARRSRGSAGPGHAAAPAVTSPAAAAATLVVVPGAPRPEAAPAEVVLYRDVLAHEPDPFGALLWLRAHTTRLAIVETAATEWPGHDAAGLIELADDWAPSIDGLRQLCLAAGFDAVEVIAGPPALGGPKPVRYRAVVHAHVTARP